MSVKVEEVSKIYGTQEALKNVSFEIKSGEVVGFIGPNGAGKSTMMKIITSYLTPTSGKVFINNINVIEQPVAVKKLVGYLPEYNPLYHSMYVKEYLLFVAGLYNLSKPKVHVDEMIDKVGLGSEKHKTISALSKGYKQRVGLAQALIHNPSVLILDEPTSGLDPNQIVDIRNLIAEAGKEKTVMLSTHIMQEVEAICDRIIIIDKGQIVADNTTPGLYQQSGSIQTYMVEFKEIVQAVFLQGVTGVSEVRHIDGNTWLVASSIFEDIREVLFNESVKKGYTILMLQKKEKKLEDVFRELTNKKE